MADGLVIARLRPGTDNSPSLLSTSCRPNNEMKQNVRHYFISSFTDEFNLNLIFELFKPKFFLVF